MREPRRLDRRLQLVQLHRELSAPLGQDGGFGTALGGRWAKGGDLGLEGVDADGVLGLGLREKLAPCHQFRAQRLQCLVRGPASLERLFGAAGHAFPGGIVDLCLLRRRGNRNRLGGRFTRRRRNFPDRGFGGGRILRKARSGPSGRKADNQRKAQHEGALGHHASSNTLGRSAGARSSQPGTGRPFSLRKAGLNSLDW
jgi:hypothetical protein